MALCGDAAHPMMPNLGQGGFQATEDGYRLIEELSKVQHTKDVPGAHLVDTQESVLSEPLFKAKDLLKLGSDLLVDFDLMMTIPLLTSLSSVTLPSTVTEIGEDEYEFC